MLQAHKQAFFQTADRLHCWIGLREPNKHSEAYIGKQGYIAKDEHCKAKSADNPFHPFKGLVVSPELCKEAFLPGSLPVALEKWRGFVKPMPAGYSVEQTGTNKGLVKYNGKFIHADFDLMYVNKAGTDGKMIFTSFDEQKKLLPKVAAMVNKLIGSDVVLHGAELGWKGNKHMRVGARESEYVLSFGPRHAFRQDRSSMPTGEGRMH